MTSTLLITKLKKCRPFYRHQIARIFSRNSHWSKNRSYVNGASNDPLKAYTIGELFDDAVRQVPDREYLVSWHENKRYTFASMDAEVHSLCKSFSAVGLERGDRIGSWMPNCALYISLTVAAARLGLVLVNINPAYRSEELKHSLTLVGVKCLVTLDAFKKQNYPEIIEEIDPDIFKRAPNTPTKSKVLPMLKTIVFNTEKRMNGAYNLESFLDFGSNTTYEIPNIQPDEGCTIQFTSGTTGKPKAALLNHMGLVNNTYSVAKRLGVLEDVSKEIVNKCCCSMPLFHAFALIGGLLMPILSKSTVLLPSAHFEPKATVDVIIKEKCTFFFGTPTLYVDVLSVFKKLPQEQRDNSLRLAVTGGAPCSPDLMNEFKSVFPSVKFGSVFGMTETSPCTFQNFMDDKDEKILSTVGHVHDHVEAKVVDANGEMLPFGTPGELLIRGYVTMSGYFNDEEKTKETIDSNRWLHTGDQFVLYEDGYGNYVGRIKEMIIRGGENIFPKEIEFFLESHPSITQAQVYGIPDQRMGEVVCASITVREGSTITEADVKAYSKGKIAHFKIPKYVFVEKDGFPKTGSGKVQKYKLKELALQRIASISKLHKAVPS